MKKYFLFDLDGTVTDTGEGIMKSAQYALDHYGIHNEPEQNLRRFVGPPLHQSFQEFYGLSETEALDAVEKYRERYRTRGVLESPLYPGMTELLQELSGRAVVCLATSKPLLFARQILEMRGIAPFFSITVGANLDGSMTDKAQVIAEVLRQLGGPSPQEAVMIGDRQHDILGAQANHVDTIGVTYGYAPPGELEAAGALWTVSTTGELADLCRRLCEK